MPTRIPQAAKAAGRGPPPKWKAVIWTVAFAATTVTAAIYGAGLKFQSERSQEQKKAAEATTEEKIALLQQRRAHLFQQKIMLEKKLSDLQARIQARESGSSTR